MDKYLVVLTGAGLGGLARYLAGTWIMEKYAGRFPLGTFVINVTGSFLDRRLMTLLTDAGSPTPIGACSWSSVCWADTPRSPVSNTKPFRLCATARAGWVWLYVTGSVVLGYFGVWLGAVLAARR